MFKFLKIVLGVVLGMSVLLLSPGPLEATDIPISPTGPVYRLNNLAWGTSVQPGFNNNYFFTPLNLNESVCVYVKNNNTTNAHPFTMSITVTSDPSNTTPSDGTWTVAAANITPGLIAAAFPGLPAGMGAQVSGASQVNIQLTASTALGGAPDTANVSIVQTSGNCFSGNNVFNNAPLTVSSVTPLQVATEGLGQAYAVPSQTLTNPAGTGTVIHVNNGSRTRSIFYDRLILLCSANCTMSVIGTGGLGGTCTTLSSSNLKINSTVSTATLEGSCATQPTSTGTLIGPFIFPANIPTVIDLRGIMAPAGTPNGVSLVMTAALTGTVNASMFWYEK